MSEKSYFHWRPHPWHGLTSGPKPPQIVNAYIEITPFDLVKYEVDKVTGYLRVDRPHRTSSTPPTLYGFIPQTYCGKRVNALSPKSARADGDPLDICVISERPINKSEVILRAKVVGGLQMIDGDEADDKIIAVLLNDNVWSEVNEVADLPKSFQDRLHHYFETYKQVPGEEKHTHVEKIYNSEHAFKVVEAAIKDYEEEFWMK